MEANPDQAPSIVALIPARSGSKRLQEKNIRLLGEHPLIAYTIAAALRCNFFSAVIVSTDSAYYAGVAKHYGAEVPFLRPPQFAGDLSPDIEWLEDVLIRLQESHRHYDCFSILRPTSPFRTAETISRAWQEFLGEKGIDSLRAVEKCKQHPGKMWIVRDKRMMPLLPMGPPEQPWHSSQYSSLPAVYAQNASLEIAWTRVVFEGKTIAGNVVLPFFTREYEGLDVNQADDWYLAEQILIRGDATLPHVSQEPYRL